MSETDDEIAALINRVSVIELKLQSVEEAPLGITIADMRADDAPLIYVNDGFEALTGYTEAEIVGQNCRFLQGSETAEEPVARMRAAIADDDSVQVELRNYRKDGEQFWAEVTLTPIHSENGAVTHYVAFQQDISTRKAYERQLEQQRDDLSVLNEMVRHDIRNDLQVALASMELLQAEGDNDDDQLTTAIESINQAIGLTDIARDVADAMLDMEESHHPIEIRQLLQKELEEAQDLSPEATISVAGTIPAVQVQANELLSSVFRNLLTNALTHNDVSDPAVRVSVTEQDSEVVVVVADNGPGIPESAREHLFERGWKDPASRGTGMGLYIVRRLIDSYGGTIDLGRETEEAGVDLGGATFVVRLPTSEADELD